MKNNLFSFKKANRRKGASMELAVTLLVVTFSLSALILTTSYLAHLRQGKAEESLEKQIVFEQIGESFIESIKTDSGSSWTSKYPDFEITVDQLTLSVKEKNEEKILFEAELQDNDDGTYKIIKWNIN